MNILLIYTVKVAVYLTAFYLVYSVLLSKDTLYGRNRAFIHFSLTSSLLLPLLTLQTLKPMDIQFFGKLLSDVFITASASEVTGAGAEDSVFNPLHFIYSIYIAGVLVFILKFAADIVNLLILIIRRRTDKSHIIKFYGFNTSGFSAMGYVFINARLSEKESEEIIRHEKTHLNKNHFVDIMFIEIIKAFQWFNPVIHMFNRSLRAVHEYQADEGCLSAGVAVVNYQTLLINQVFKSNAFNLTNSFSNPSLIKKRMVMMTKKRTSSLASIKLILALPVVGIVFLAISAYKEVPVSFTTPAVPETTSQSSFIPDTPTTGEISNQPARTNTESISSKPKIVVSELKVIAAGSSMAPPPPPPPPPTESPKENEKVIENAGMEPFVVVEQMPMFPGGDAELLKFIASNTTYPETAKEQNVQGRVIVRFCITETGSVNRISVLKGVSPELDEEAMRVVRTLPEFLPGKQGGKEVPVWYMVPINFSLK